MIDKTIYSILNTLAVEASPSPKVDLWPRIRTSLPERKPVRRAFPRLAFSAALVCLVTVALFIAFPPVRAWAQDVIHLFTHASSDTRPPLDRQAPTRTSGEIAQIAALTGWPVYQPDWLPEGFKKIAVEYRPEKQVVISQFGRSDSSGGTSNSILYLAQRKTPYDTSWPVGLNAEVEPVKIGSANGEYVIGWWNAGTNGRSVVWERNPNWQHLRWQQDGYNFEMEFVVFGVNPTELQSSPLYLTREQLLQFASEVKPTAK